MDLLGDNSDVEEDEKVEINTENSYATSYDTWRQKEHIQKLKDKYGENYEEEDEEESDESSDDSEAEELDDEMEKDFFATLASLKKKDPKIYDGETVFFKEKKGTEGGEKEKVPSDKKVTLKDLETHVMLKKGGQFDEIEDKALKFGKDMSYNEEMKSIKDSFKNALNSEDEGEEEVLEKKVKTTVETQKEEVEYKSWLAGQKSSISDHEIEDKMSGLRDFWNKDNLDEGEKFLKDFLLNKRFLDKDDSGNNDDDGDAYDNVAHDSDDGLSEDEANVEKMEEFEHKFNFRFEEPDEDFIKRYPRTIKGTMRKEEDKRSKKRKEVEERKKREKLQKKEEIKMLKNAKKKEIMAKIEKLRKITGNDDMELNDDDIEGDFDPEKYDAKMKEVFNNYDDAGDADLEKPTFSDLEDEDYDEDYEAEDWDNWTGAGNAADGEEGGGGEHCEDEDFNMDCDYEANLAMQKEIVESTKGRKKGRRKSKFAEALESSQSKPAFDPKDEKTFEEYVEEYYKLDCEDIIDDVHCRFQYRSVPVNNFGLSTEEILAAEDRELNAWASLRKTCMYRREEEEKKDFHVYKNRAKDERLKKKLLPTLFKEEVEEAEIEDAGEKTGNSEPDQKLALMGKKKRKLVASGDGDGGSLKKSKPNDAESSSSTLGVNPNGDAVQVVSVSQIKGEETNPKKKKKKSKKNKGGSQGAAIQTNGMASLFAKSAQNPSNKASKSFKHQAVKSSKQKKPDDCVGLSNERLKAYGVNPNKFKRDRRKEIFKKGAKEKE